MKLVNISLNGKEVKVLASETNTQIIDSYKIRKRKDMRYILKTVREEIDGVVDERSIHSQIVEWRAHNLMYDLGYKRERTADVDLDANEPKGHKIAYRILSLFYIGI